MANICDYEFRVRGKKKAVKAFYESTPYLEDGIDVEYESGTDSNYEMHFRGNCKWSINFDVEDDCDGVTVDFSKYLMSQIEELGAEYVGYSVRAKSEIFQCEVKVHYWSGESEFDQFDYYKNGKCLKKRKIAYGEDTDFDWNALEFVGHEGEYDKNVDGEQRDIDFMNKLGMLFGNSAVPSKKPKKNVNSSVSVTASAKKPTTLFKGIKITRNKNNVVKGEGYNYVVPDGFKVGKEAGRDFVAWLPSSMSSSIEDATIRIYAPPQKDKKESNEIETYCQKSPLLCEVYQAYRHQLINTQSPLGAILNYEYFPTVLSHTSGGCLYSRTSEYYTFIVSVFIGDHFERFRFDVVGVTTSNESAAQNLVRELADGIIPDKPFNLPEPLNGEKYRSAILTAAVVKEWSENFNSQLKLQLLVGGIRKKTVEEKIQHMSSEGDVDMNEINGDIRWMLREYLDAVVRLVEEAIDIIGFFSHQGANMAYVTKLRSETVDHLENNKEISLELDGEVIREEIKQLGDLKERIARADGFNSVISSKKNAEREKHFQHNGSYIKPKTKLSNEEIDAKILELVQNGGKYTVKELRDLDDDIDSLSPQKLSAALRRMVQNGCLTKLDENGDSYYTNMSREKIKEMQESNYAAANQLMLNAKTPEDFQKAADAFEKLGNYCESESNLRLCTAQKQKLEDANAYDSAIKEMNHAKSSEEMSKVALLFESLDTYRDSKDLARKCKERAEALKEEEHKYDVYKQAIEKITSYDIAVLKQAIAELDSIAGWRDADIQAYKIRTKISDIVAAEERERIEVAKKKKKKKTVTTLVLIGVAALVIFIIIFFAVIKPSMNYEKAIDFMNDGNDKAAANLFVELGDYKDSQYYLDEMCQNNSALKFYIANVGDVVTLGTYDHGYGVQEIEWYVLAKQDDRVLLISKYILDAQPFDEGHRVISWEQSTLHSWLEGDFYDKAFSSDEKRYTDVCLPSKAELEGYFESLPEEIDWLLKTSPTSYAISQGLEKSSFYKEYYWWTGDRAGKYVGGEYLAGVVYENDMFIGKYVTASYEVGGVRPFAWIDVD